MTPNITPDATPNATPAHQTPQRMCCRYIKSDGYPCRGVAIRGQLYCHSHGRDLRRYRQLSAATPIYIPRLDNRADIQQVATDVARALAASVIDHASARLILAAGRLASAQLPPPRATLNSKDAKSAQPEPEAVEEVFPGPNGEELAPETPYYGPNGRPERKWDLGEFLYHKIFPGNEGKPLPEEGYAKPSPHPSTRLNEHPSQPDRRDFSEAVNPENPPITSRPNHDRNAESPEGEELGMNRPKPTALSEQTLEPGLAADLDAKRPLAEELGFSPAYSGSKDGAFRSGPSPQTLIIDRMEAVAGDEHYRSTISSKQLKIKGFAPTPNQEMKRPDFRSEFNRR